MEVEKDDGDLLMCSTEQKYNKGQLDCRIEVYDNMMIKS